MASAELNRLIDDARVRLPGALDTQIQQELFRVMNEFLQGSNIWQEDIPFTTNTVDTAYDIEPSVGTINMLLLVANSDGVPQRAYMREPGVVTFDSAPTKAETLTATVAITVDDPVNKDGYPVFPAWILSKYNSGLLDGILGRMMTQPAKPYSNIAMGQIHYRRFRNTVAQAKVEAARKNVYRSQAWAFPTSFATTRRQR